MSMEHDALKADGLPEVLQRDAARSGVTATITRRGALMALLAAGASLATFGCRRADASGDSGSATLPRMAPRDLAARLDEVRDGKLAVLHVGPAYLFGKSRIPHARHAGEASTEAGYASLVAALRKLPAGREVVLYCGCCPTKNCPNVAPAERAAREGGLRRAQVLDLPTTLKADWSDHGYPVEKG